MKRKLSTLLMLSVSVSCYVGYDVGPYGRQTKQYISRPYSTLVEECRRTRVIVEHCHRGSDGLMQYTTCADRRLQIVNCRSPKTQCSELYDYDEKTGAECVNPIKRPAFPKTGLISWNGTHKHNSSTFFVRPPGQPRWQSSAIYGRAGVDKNGNFYLAERTVQRWNEINPPFLKTSYTIVMPYEDGKFVVYEAEELDKRSPYSKKRSCKRSIVNSPRTLSSLWKQLKFYSRYNLEETETIAHGVDRQKWVEIVRGEEWDSTRTWTMDYKHDEGYAIPMSSYWVYNGDYEGKDRVWKEYSYKPLEDNVGFRMPAYCK